MIKKIHVKNFKCFKDCFVKLKNFNVICGPNSSGKSSIIQALLLMLQNNNLHDKSNFINNGKFVHFDEFEEIKNVDISSDKPVNIQIFNSKNKKNELKLISDDNGKIKCDEYNNEFEIFEEINVYYLSSNRLGPEDVYNKYNDKLIGQYGENSIGFLAKYQDNVIDEKFAYEKNPTKDYIFIKEINYWLQEIIGEKVYVNEILKTDRSTATYIHGDNNIFKVRNKNTGTGLSYVISVLIMVFSLVLKEHKEKPLFVIENPEIHLHPVAQIKLMKFLLFMSQFCQIIIETHSEKKKKNALQNHNGQVIKLNLNYIPEYYNYKSKFTLRTLTRGEIQWAAFDLPTIDFHIALYSYLQRKFNKYNNNELDDEIRKTTSFKSNKKIFDTRCRRFGNYANAMYKTETLPVYMRNLIDHPEKNPNRNEPLRKKYRKPQEFYYALKISIEFMIQIIKEKGW